MSESAEELARRTPPGQVLTRKWPVLTYGLTPRFDPGTWSFRCWGLVEEEVSFTWEEFLALPRAEVTCDIHCVTHWSRLDNRFEGVSIRELMRRVRVKPEARYVLIHADPDYTTNLPLEDIRDGKAWVAYEYGGEPLHPEHGGPARLLVPHLYFWKSAKWVRGLTLTLDDEPGFWEAAGYNNYGDPWREQRYWGD